MLKRSIILLVVLSSLILCIEKAKGDNTYFLTDADGKIQIKIKEGAAILIIVGNKENYKGGWDWYSEEITVTEFCKRPVGKVEGNFEKYGVKA